MGNKCLSSIPDLPYKDFMAITFSFDTIYTVYAGNNELQTIRTIINRHWTKGIQKEEAVFEGTSNVYTFKLLGRPFMRMGNLDTKMETWRMCSDMVQQLRNMGWKLLVSSDLSSFFDNSTWVFQRQPVQPDTYKFLTIALRGFDKIAILDCPDDIYTTLKELIIEKWPKGIQNVKEKEDLVHQIQLKGWPWRCNDKLENCAVRSLVKDMLCVLQKRQLMLYCNSNLNEDADTLLFHYDPSHVSSTDDELITLSLNQLDRIRMIGMEKHLIELIENTVRENWSRGIQDIKEDSICYELKLKGHPWWTFDSEGIESRMLMLRIIERLAQVGYYITTTLDLSKGSFDKSMLVFKKGAPMATTFMCIAPQSNDLISFVNAPPDLVQVARKVIHGIWVAGFEEKMSKLPCVSYEVKLVGNPWHHIQRDGGIHGRALMLHILSEFMRNGWRLICSAEISAKVFKTNKANPRSADPASWYFMRDPTLLSL